MKTNKIIGIWGNPNSGKTSLAMQMAERLNKKEKSVIVILTDPYVPVASTLFPEIDVKEQSLGAVLSDVSITQESILARCVPVKDTKNVSVLSYLQGENIRTYADYGEDRIIDLFIHLKHLVDYVIIDCSSYFQHNLLTQKTLEVADSIIRLITADVKAISYYEASLPLLMENKYQVHKHIKVMSKVQTHLPKGAVSSYFGGVDAELEYSKILEENMLKGAVYQTLIDKKSDYTKQLDALMERIYIEDFQEKNEEKNKSKFFFNIRRN